MHAFETSTTNNPNLKNVIEHISNLREIESRNFLVNFPLKKLNFYKFQKSLFLSIPKAVIFFGFIFRNWYANW